MCVRKVAIIIKCFFVFWVFFYFGGGGVFFMYRVSIMDFIVNALPLPVIPLNRMTQIVASRPAPQTQNRGRRRLRLGLLAVLIPPAASAPVSTCRGLLTPHSGCWLSHNTVASLIYLLDAILSAVSICATKPEVRPVISISASRARLASTPDIPTAPACRRTSAAGVTKIIHIDPEHRLLPPVSPLSARQERVFFSEDHQGAPSAGWGVWSHGEPWLRGSHRYISNIREAGRSNAT